MRPSKNVTESKRVTKSPEHPSSELAALSRAREDLNGDRSKFEAPHAGMAGNSRAAAAQRRQRFIDAYLSNGHNATQAAITAGFSPKTACAQGQRLLRKVEVSGEIARAAKQAAVTAGLERERTLEEITHISCFDPRKLFNADGTLKSPDEWDVETASAVASFETVEKVSGQGAERAPKARISKVKLWDKNAALDKAMKHLGLYESDNAQRGPNLAVQIVLVGPP